MQITKQLAIFLDNRPGTLARVCDALSAAKVEMQNARFAASKLTK